MATKDSQTHPNLSAFMGGGEMGALIRAHDWSKTALGEPSSWPQSLKTALSICLGSKFPMVIWWGKDFSVFYNDAYIPIAGPLKHPMFLGRPAQEQWPDIWDVVGKLAEHVVSSGEATFSEDQPLFMERHGYVEEAYFTFSFSPARDETGAVGGMFCAVQEMTGRVIGERRLRTLRELGGVEAKSVPELARSAAKILGKNPNDVPFGLIYTLNDDKKTATLSASFGLPEASKASPPSIDLHESGGDPWSIAEVSRSKSPIHITGLRSKFSTDLPALPYPEKPDSAFVLPMESSGKELPEGFLVLGINPRLEFNDTYQGFFGLLAKQITSQIVNVLTLEEEKKRSEALAEIDRAKTAFFSNVSHEFRTPLTLMLGPIEDMLSGRKGELPNSLVEEAQVIHRNSLRLLKLVNALLDFSRLEAGRMQASYVPTDLGLITENIASSFRSIIETSGINFGVQTDKFDEPAYIDRDMWEKIVLNLISNAYKYTLQGEIRLSLTSNQNDFELRVADTGVGIPLEELPKIFNRFHRVEGSNGRTHEGTGIGLALVQELIKLHGGSIRAESVLGKGSTFIVTIPRGNLHLPQGSVNKSTDPLPAASSTQKPFIEEALTMLPEKSSRETEQTQGTHSRKKIVIVDDNADMRNYVSGLLEDHYEVIGAADGKAGLTAIRTHNPDLILSDIMMPIMDGIEMLSILRADAELKTKPVILLSARAGEEAKASGIETGADDYLTKPFSAKELLARVRTQLHMADIRQEAAQKEAIVKQLGKHQKWLEDVLDLVPTPLLLMQQESGRIEFANQAAHKMAGGEFPMDIPLEEYEKNYSVTDEQGAIIPIGELPAARASRGKKVRDFEMVWHTPSGHFSLLVDSEIVPAIEGEEPKVILCLRDVTRMKEIQSELKRLIGARDEFLSIASHELKTPLTSISIQTQMIKRDLARNNPSALEPGKIRKMVEQTDRQIGRLSHLVDDMLDVARIETGRVVMDYEEFNLVDVVKETVDRLAPQISVAGESITVRGPDLVRGKWDRFRVEQLLTNLLTNAGKYGEGRAIAVKVSPHPSTVEISVTDQGKGIEKSDQMRIFERFERATPSSEVSGLGLGLYITKQMVVAHGGSIRLESEPGKGSTFIVSLPIAPRF